MRTIFTWLMTAGLLAAFAWWLSVATEPPRLAASKPQASSTFTVEGPHYREFNREGLALEATAVTATYAQLSGVANADRLGATVYHSGRPTYVHARHARYELSSETATLYDGVRIDNDDGYVMNTTTAVYRHELETVTADGRFSAEGRGLRLEGMGIEYNLRSDTFTVKRDVGASISGFRL